jgi:methionine-rich copper-binding protein CopC
MTTRRIVALGAALAALGGGQALAHARLIHALPKVGATIRQSPRELLLLFSETIDPRQSAISLTGPAGPVPTGPLFQDRQDTRVVHMPIRATVAPGAYRVEWDVRSMDTHRTEGNFSFRIVP